MGVSQFRFFLVLFFVFYVPKWVHGNTELRALMELKASLDPTNKVLESWRSDGDPCSGSFMGVACNEHRKVANISLQGKGLSGKLSPAIAGFKCLSGLYLHYNSLSGKIPQELSQLQELTDLYLNVNNLSGSIPPQIGNMAGLQVLQLCCNQLTGNIPTQIGSLKQLNVVALQYNRLDGKIPPSLGNLRMLKRLDLSFNSLFDAIPPTLADIPELEILDVRNNTLSGLVPSGLKRLNEGFQGDNNPGLCGAGFPLLRRCGPFDGVNINQVEPFRPHLNNTAPEPGVNSHPSNVQRHCNHTHCSRPSRFPEMPVISGVTTVVFIFTVAGLFAVIHYRRQKQKIGNTSGSSDESFSIDQKKEILRNGSVSPLITLEYSYGWDPLGDGWSGIGFSQEHLNKFRFNLEEVESATRCFSELNLLGKTNFSAVYKGVLKDRSIVAIRSINVTSCKSEEAEFVKGLYLLTSLRHENLVRLRGFCFSRGRGECFLIYDFASKGNLSKYLDLEDGSEPVLDWSTRISIINGTAKGLEYLHKSEANKPPIVHRNISVEKVLIDQQFNPLIADSGLHKIFADDIVYSTLKVSAAMGYLAPEYIMTGRFTEKTDVFAFGVIILQILSGKLLLTSSMRSGAETSKFEDFVDKNLRGEFSESMASKLGKIALNCTNEEPNDRPSMETIIKELNDYSVSS
ncbi:nsp-interacting kinase 2 -like protein [Gossypium arboreum]|uniref:Nsp-interacting kinase 2-like protein n=1 Tax=Gossypium arboreum TaxID=29729 RepID=A0A0B0NPV5_GOSAR|nr:LRR receptor-like serine/threonine-protein kinase GSO2 [Gossypium arboreum]KHG14855.1 nsp-interacting kinase 2 -like protein [Gossypium arboreum]